MLTVLSAEPRLETKQNHRSIIVVNVFFLFFLRNSNRFHILQVSFIVIFLSPVLSTDER